MLIDHITSKYQVSSDLNGNCDNCTHPTSVCSGCCQKCLDEIHWGPKPNERTLYNCRRLVHCYVSCFVQRYFENINTACGDIDFAYYPYFSILSIGCGASPDLMAFEAISDGKPLFRNYFLISKSGSLTTMFLMCCKRKIEPLIFMSMNNRTKCFTALMANLTLNLLTILRI